MVEKLFMQILKTILITAALINLAACSNVVGNVVPTKGPDMEQVYDGMHQQQNADAQNSDLDNQSLSGVRQNLPKTTDNSGQAFNSEVNSKAVNKEFHQIPNPELKLYVFPHLTGNDDVPIPGYTTVFNAYTRDYYTLQ